VIVVSVLASQLRPNFTKIREIGYLILHWKWLPDMHSQQLDEAIIRVSHEHFVTRKTATVWLDNYRRLLNIE